MRKSLDINPSAAGARDLRLLQAATKTLQLERVQFFGVENRILGVYVEF